jgi:chemotaxis response regulator CheB
MLVVAPTIGDATSAAGDDEGIVGYARSIAEATALAGDLHPDVLVLDGEVARNDTENELAALRQASPGASVFIVTDVRGVLELARAHGDVAVFLNRARLGLTPIPTAAD